MTVHSLNDFVRETAMQTSTPEAFEVQDGRMLRVDLNGLVWTKIGAMVAYTGAIKFTREGVMEHGLGRMLKRAVSGEGMTLMKCEGQGHLYLAHEGKQVSLLRLAGESITVNGNDLLALEPSLQWDITLMRRVAGMMAGGFSNVKVEGHGVVAITTHHEPLTLVVTPGNPVMTDPNATVLWSTSLTPELRTEISFKTFLGRGSGESFQMMFQGQGFVVIQPYEETYLQADS